jgi:hypothetical protein
MRYGTQTKLQIIQAAFRKMDEEWLQNELGDGITDVIYDALMLLQEAEEKKLGTSEEEEDEVEESEEE